MKLTTFLKRNEHTRKVFGKRELKIIEKQLDGISLTQSEKNRLSRDIRPKFKFIKECSRFEKYFKLKKGSSNQQLLEEALEVILEDKLFKEINQVILFGSMVKNQMTIRSDIDIAVKFKEIDLKEATKFRIRIAGRVSDKIDIQVWNVLPNKIRKSIKLKFKVLYDNQ